MKKLMIAAVVVAMGGVMSATAAVDEGCDYVGCPFAYRIKLAGKTVVGKTAKSDKLTPKEEGEGCGYATDCWAKPASYRLAGYIWGDGVKGEDECSKCGCIDYTTFDNEAIFWDANKVQQFADVTSVEFEVFDILRNGGLKNKAQIAFKLGDVQLAGFGVYNPKTQKLKSANGFFAGKLDAPKCAGEWNKSSCDYGEGKTAQVFAPCALDTAEVAKAAIVYGRWSLTYRADKVAAYSAKKGGDKSVFYPSAFKYADAVAEDEDND